MYPENQYVNKGITKTEKKSLLYNIFDVVVDCKGFLFDLWHC